MKLKEGFKVYLKTLILASLLFSFVQINAGWLDRKAEGWAWYEDPEILEKTKEEVQQKPIAFSASDRLEESKKILNEKLAQAVLEPTIENVEDYIKEQNKRIEMASEFSKSWAKALLYNPSLDVTAKENAVSFYGAQVQKQVQQQKKENLIANIAKESGLFFFYNGSEQESQAFALVVKILSDKYHFEVLGISADGVLIDKFKNSRADNGISARLEVQVFPSLFVVNPITQQIIPVSFGMRALDQIEDNIFMQFNDQIEAEND